MALNLRIDPFTPQRSTLYLEGRLDAISFGEFDKQADKVLEQMNTGSTLVLDLSALDYISSAGLRSIAKARKAMRARDGQTLLVNPQVQVRKVFDIVKAVPVNEIFQNVRELDDYLDRIQRRVLHEGEELE
ncbi:STAS domain-containing protein [Dyella nitratireducens]|uniref:Anti-sigma factor antagonist n=1 Tax=Dyella nitratireducens TaxID=1849580 RepID=A0ABQ1GYN5_9GAMM|nr:STAS domain-containing protein [Dyella nitratireducens]GGA52032.1 anti-sigma factor antagonist [Dyella nitratireducens]GLQ41625.1 anti-sigma factor antagonist [Dyella nitratireducens]